MGSNHSSIGYILVDHVLQLTQRYFINAMCPKRITHKYDNGILTLEWFQSVLGNGEVLRSTLLNPDHRIDTLTVTENIIKDASGYSANRVVKFKLNLVLSKEIKMVSAIDDVKRNKRNQSVHRQWSLSTSSSLVERMCEHNNIYR